MSSICKMKQVNLVEHGNTIHDEVYTGWKWVFIFVDLHFTTVVDCEADYFTMVTVWNRW